MDAIVRKRRFSVCYAENSRLKTAAGDMYHDDALYHVNLPSNKLLCVKKWKIVMCEIDWNLAADMLTGIGTLLAGIAAVFVLPWQLGFRKEAKESKKQIESLHASLKLMFPLYKQYMASEEGIVWENYPGKDANKIIKGISQKFALNEELVKETLDALKNEGKI